MTDLLDRQRDQPHLDTLLDMIPEPALRLDPSWTITYLNPAARQLWGEVLTTGVSLHGHTLVQSLYTPTGEPLVLESSPLARTLRAGEPQHDLNFTVRLPGQEVREVRVSSAPLFSGGAVSGAVVVVQPLTTYREIRAEVAERNRALQALNDLALRLGHLNSRQEIYETALDGLLAILGSGQGAVMCADDGPRVFEMVAHRGYQAATLEQTRRVPYEQARGLRQARETGELVVVHPETASPVGRASLSQEQQQTAVLIPVLQGDAIPTVLVYLLEEYRDPTASQREVLRTAATSIGVALARAALYEQAEAERARIEAVLHQMPAGVIIAEAPSGRLILGNEQVDRIWRQPFIAASSIAQYDAYHGYYPDGRPYTPEGWPLARAIRSGEIVTGEEIEIERGDGTRGFISISAAPIRNSEGQIVAAVVTFSDITERKHLEGQVRRQAEAIQTEYTHLATVIANVHISLVLLDATGHIVLVNDTWLKRRGETRERVLGRRYEELADNPSVAGTQAAVDQVLATGEPVLVHDLRLPGATRAEDIYVDWSALPLRAADGTISGALNISVDVTEKVRAREQIEDQRALLQTVFESTPVGITLYDRNMAVVEMNAEQARLAGLDRAAAEGKTLYELSPVALARRALYERVLAGESINLDRLSHQFPDGTVRYYDVRYRPVRDADGMITGLLSTAIDVTEPVQGQQQLEAQRGLLETMVAAAPIGIAFFDRDMRIVTLNVEWARMTGADFATARGQVLYDLLPNMLDRRAAHQRALNGEAVDLDDVVYHLAGEEHPRHYEVHFRPIWDKDGAIAGILVAARDVTARHEIDQQKDEFIALASHELKTPVTAIKGYAQSGLRGATRLGDERLVRTLRIIDEQSNRLTRLINELLDVSRTQNNTLSLYAEPFDLRRLAHEVVSNLQLTAPDFTLDLHLPPTPVMVNADRQRIEQVLINLLQNAIKYSGQHQRVEVSLAVEGDEVLTAVRDFGVGIPLDQQPQVFERFFRARNVSSRHYSGLGLGLFIAHGIVTRHGGRMWLQSIEGEGSTFTFALPLVRESQ